MIIFIYFSQLLFAPDLEMQFDIVKKIVSREVVERLFNVS